MSSTLGHRKDAEHNAERPQEFARNKQRQQQIAARVINVPDTTCERKSRFHIPCALPSRGFIIALFYAGLLLATPVCLEYTNISYDSNLSRGLIIGASAVLAFTVAHAGTTVAWFNMILLFHTGVEAKVLDIAITAARGASGDTTKMALSSVGAGIVGLHLLPFFLTDRSSLIVVLAMAGIIVNTAVLVFLDETKERLLLVGSTSLSLLVMTLVVTTSGVKASVKTQLYCALFS